MMFKRIVVPLDGSNFAEKVLPHLPRFSDPTQTHVELLGVLETRRYVSTIGYAPLDVGDLYTQYETYLQERVQQLQAQHYQADFKMADGDAAEKILEAAAAISTDVIAMATHGRSGVARWTLGSVAERVIQGATLPVLLVREATAATPEKIKRILVPLDGSTLAEKALLHAEKLVKATGAELLLFQAIPLTASEASFDHATVQTALNARHEQLFANADAYLNSLALRLWTADIPCKIMVLGGDPAQLIADITRDSDIDMVVLSTHGRTGFNRWVHGSVANQVIRSVNCPVLVIPNTETENVKEPIPASIGVPVAV